MKTPWIIFLVTLTHFATAQGNYKFPPVDESEKSPALKAFVTELKQIIKAKDSQALLKHLHPQIKLDFDDGLGVEKFKEIWKPENRSSELWTILEKITTLGGVFSKNRTETFYDFVFPYVNAVELEDPDQYFNIVVILEKDVNVHESPDITSKMVGQLSYDIVTYDYEKSNDKYSFIQTHNKKITGYVNSKLAYSPVDYRMFLTHENGRWQISCIVAGD